MILSDIISSSHHIYTIFLNNKQLPLAVRHKIVTWVSKICNIANKIFLQKMIEIYKDSLQYKDSL